MIILIMEEFSKNFFDGAHEIRDIGSFCHKLI